MPEQVVPITGLDTVGLIEDVPPVSLPPAAFSDCRNVRFRDGAVSKMEGDVNIMPYIRLADEDILRYVAWWPNPNLAFASLGYYLVIVEQLGSTGLITDNAYLLKVNELGIYTDPTATTDGRVSLVPTADSFKGSFLPAGNWQHTFFQGGFSLIVNNGLEAPRFILDSDDNTETANVPDFAELPGWASYAADPVYIALLAMSDANEGVDPRTLNTTAGVIRDFGDFLVAGNLLERGDIGVLNDQGMFIGTGTYSSESFTPAQLMMETRPVTIQIARSNAVLRALPGIIRSSDIAAPGAVPQNWNPFATAVNTADEFTITNDGIVQDFVELQGNLYIYSNSSISSMTRTNNPNTPLSVRPVTTAYGTLTTDAVLEFDGKHFVVGAQDIYIFGGHPGSIQSVGDGRIRDTFYNNLNPLSIDNVFLLRYQQKDEIWICYPDKDSVSGLVNQAYIWNYRKNNWTKRDLQNVVAGDVAPVPGGGLPLAELIFSGNSGNNNAITSGSVHTNSITSTQDLLVAAEGIEHQYEIRVGADFPILPESGLGTPIHGIRFGQDFDSGTAGRELNFTVQGRTFVAMTNAGRFLQVPNYVSGVADGTFRDFNFTVELPAGLTSTASPSSQAFSDEVTIPVFLALLRQDPEDFTWEGVDDFAVNPAIPQGTRDFITADIAANGPLPVFDSNAPITLHLTDQADTFVLQYEVIPNEVLPYTSFIQIGRASEYFDEPSLSAARQTTNDQIGDRIVEEREPAKPVGTDPITGTPITGVANTFYFNFEDIVNEMPPGDANDILNSLVFFFKSTTVDATDPSGFAPLPTNAVVFRPDPLGSFESEEERIFNDEMGGMAGDGARNDGGMAGQMAGDGMDGERRINRTFELDLIQDEPILGSTLLSRLQYTDPEGVVHELHETPLQIWVPDGTTEVTDFQLVAYTRPTTTDGDADVTTDAETRRNIVIEDIDPALLVNVPPIVEFRGQQQEYEDNSNNLQAGWTRGDVITPGYNTGDFEFTVALAYDSGVDDPTINAAYRAAQRQAFAEAIEAGFFNNSSIPLRSISNVLEPATGDWVITLRSVRRIAVQLEIGIQNATVTATDENDMSVTETITVDDPFTAPSQADAHIRIAQTVQGKYDYTSDPAVTLGTDQRLLIPPAMRITYTDPEIRFFDFDTMIFQLQRTDRTNTSNYSVTDWTTQVTSVINATHRLPHWAGVHASGALALSTIAVRYDSDLMDTGVEVPDINPATNRATVVDFPLQREGVNFVVTYNEGSGWASAIGTDFIQPVSTISTQGAYPTANTPSYIALRVSDNSVLTAPSPGEEVFLFPISNDQDTTAVVTELQAQLTRRAPRLRALVSGTGRLSVQPANYNDLANFVLEFVINNTASIDRMRALLNPALFNQDEFNPKPSGDLPERVQFGRDENVNEVDNTRGFIEVAQGGLQIDNTQDPTFEFDVLRPWPKTQINFTLEFPIFAATRPFEDGATSNKVIGADIGFSRPAFDRPEVRRVETPVASAIGSMSTLITVSGQDDPTDYESYIERVQQGLSPEFDTEFLSSVALWTDGRTQAEFRGPFAYNSVEFRGLTSDNPGDPVDLTNTSNLEIRNVQHISEGYKVDTRLTGRFINWRLTDQSDETQVAPMVDGKSFNNQTLWRLSGLQLEIGKAGRR